MTDLQFSVDFEEGNEDQAQETFDEIPYHDKKLEGHVIKIRLVEADLDFLIDWVRDYCA